MQIDGNQTPEAARSWPGNSTRTRVAPRTGCLPRYAPTTAGECSIDRALEALHAYDSSSASGPHGASTRETLRDRPWKRCRCEICAAVGIHVVDLSRDRAQQARGFHNLQVFDKRCKRSSRARVKELRVPALGISAVRNARSTPSRSMARCCIVRRRLSGRTRRDAAIAATNARKCLHTSARSARTSRRRGRCFRMGSSSRSTQSVRFESRAAPNARRLPARDLVIPLDEEDRPGWIVDGQQRAAAIRDAGSRRFRSSSPPSSPETLASNGRSSSSSTRRSRCRRG